MSVEILGQGSRQFSFHNHHGTKEASPCYFMEYTIKDAS